jgi:hypothetical protein
MLKTILLQFKVIIEIISSSNSADEVNSIAYCKHSTALEEMNEKSHFGSREKGRRVREERFEKQIMTTMMILDPIGLEQRH